MGWGVLAMVGVKHHDEGSGEHIRKEEPIGPQ